MSSKDPRPIERPDIVSEQRAAAVLNKSPSTLGRWRRNNIGPPYIKNGRTVEYRFSDLDEYRQRCRHDPGHPVA
jgi:hypothetical protein